MRATRRDVIKTALLTLTATSAGMGIGFTSADEAQSNATDDASALTPEGWWDRDEGPTRGRDSFDREAFEIYERHWQQTPESVARLRAKYARPVLGEVKVWDAVQRLALCVDRSDTTLYCANQLIHIRQILAAMEASGVSDEDLIVTAFTHDLGKILILEGEPQENVVCANRPIGTYKHGVGLDNVTFQWNHDEFMYTRLKGHVPDHVAWVVRYHSIDLQAAAPLMNRRDIAWAEQYLAPFRHFDVNSKSAFSLPPREQLEKYQKVLERALPQPIPI